jgi:two-component system OmpR family response regulator
VDLADNGLAAERMAADSDYDAIVLDIMLPGPNGFDLCRRLRREANDPPVLMLTARDAVADRVERPGRRR